MHIFYLEIHCHFQSTSYMHSGGGDVIYLKKTVFWKLHTWLLYLHHYIISSSYSLPAFKRSHSSSLPPNHMTSSLTTVICSHTYAKSLQCCSCVWVFTNGHEIGQHFPRKARFPLSQRLPGVFICEIFPIHVGMPAGVTMQVLCRWPPEDCMYYSYNTKCKSHIKLLFLWCFMVNTGTICNSNEAIFYDVEKSK